MGQSLGIDTIWRHPAFEEMMVADQMDDEAGALHRFARLSIRDQPVDGAVPHPLASSALAATRIARPRTDLKTLVYLHPAFDLAEGRAAGGRRLGRGKESLKPGGDLRVIYMQPLQGLRIGRDDVREALVRTEKPGLRERPRPHSRFYLAVARWPVGA
jgi:hypothetical protein